MTGKSVAIIGSATVDEVVHGNERSFQLGGVVTYAGLTFRRFGVETLVITNVADEDRAILDALSREEIHLHAGSSPQTTRFVNRIEGDARTQELPRVAEPIRRKQIEGVLKGLFHVHIGALHPDDIDPRVFKCIRTAGLFASADIQGYVRFSDQGRVIQRVSDRAENILRLVSVLKADEGELQALTGFFKVDAGKLIRQFEIEEILVTAGSRGGYLLTKEEEVIPYRARAVEKPRSTVGAGDVFFAAYLAERYYRRKDIRVSLDSASELAARQVEGHYIPPEALALREGIG
ncbi:MAG TPA: PfkB family carbohydrate kinase [Syntrophales bacterium]|nr:PfkB family carbohydrate kinase [Syntrophales bacterium]HPI58188.1 PfkB family carbohydrate kinase [Syntrophales bacterium]HQM30321.1 PfkB family carbohydrate kinase [Syntrophales bacterium]